MGPINELIVILNASFNWNKARVSCGIFSVSNESCTIVPYASCPLSPCWVYNEQFKNCYEYSRGQYNYDRKWINPTNPPVEIMYYKACRESIKDRMKICDPENSP